MEQERLDLRVHQDLQVDRVQLVLQVLKVRTAQVVQVVRALISLMVRQAALIQVYL